MGCCLCNPEHSATYSCSGCRTKFVLLRSSRAWTRFFCGALSTGSAAKHEDNSVSSLLTFAVAISGRACVVNLSAYPSLVQLVHLSTLPLLLGYFFSAARNNKPISATKLCFACPSDLCLTKIILSTQSRIFIGVFEIK